MERVRARDILGVEPGASRDELRGAFRSLLRRTHPDVAQGDAGAGRATALLVEAYATLRSAAPDPGARTPATAAATPRSRAGGVVIDGDSLHVSGPPDEVYRRLVEAAHGIGEITYLDPDARLLDTIVISGDGVACSLLASLQGRSASTEIFFTLEPLGGEPGPPVEPIVAAISERFVDPAPPSSS